MFDNLKMGVKLGVACAFVVALTVVTGILALARLSQLNDDVSDLARQDMVRTRLSASVVDNLNVTARAIRNMALVSDRAERDKEATRIDEANSAIAAALGKLEPLEQSSSARAKLRAVSDARAEYLPVVSQARQLALDGKTAEATAVLVGPLRQVQSRYMGAVAELLQADYDEADATASRAAASYDTSRNVLLGLMIGVVAAAVVVVAFTVRKLTEPLNACVNAANRIAAGDTGVTLDTRRRDELGTLMVAMQRMSDNISALIRDTAQLADAAKAGKLSTRANASAHEGDYRALLQGVNDTLDAVINPLHVAAGYVDRISKGDIPPKITDSYQGDFNAIKSNLNQCIDAIGLMASDVRVLSRAAVAGKLTARADASRHHGEFRTIVSGVNDTLDALVGFIDAMPAAAFICDPSFTILYANHMAAKAAGMAPHAMVGTKCYTHYRTPHCQTDQCATGQCMRRGSSVQSEVDAHPQGMTVEIAYGGVPVKDDQGRVIGAMEVFTDQTAIKVASRKSLKIAGFQSKEVDRVVRNLDKFARGDMAVDTMVTQGDDDTREAADAFRKIHEAQAHAATAVQALVKDADLLSKAAVEGKLATRADASRHEGDYRRIVQGVNDTLDAVITPLNVAASYVDRISKGDIPPKITDSYQGDFNTIKSNVNTCVDAVNMLVADAVMLSKAAVEGKLSTRADVSRHQGDFKRIVEGVNETLDQVLAPVNDAAKVLEALANSDMRARVHGAYQGDHARIKESVNRMAVALHEALVQVAEATDQVSGASAQIASSSQSVSQGATEQASSLEETSSTLEEISSMTKQNADNTQQAKVLAQSTKSSADHGSVAMSKMMDSMRNIRAAAEGTAAIIADINEIAFQTNLLALNAAVEAARAGDAGRGFAVVAEEVRNLALRSKEAAKKTDDLIKESVKLAGEGEEITNVVAANLTEIVSSVGKVTDIVSEIAVASQEQARGVDQVNRAVSQMEQVVQQAAANSEETSSAAEELASQAQGLAAMVGSFRLDRRSGGAEHANVSGRARAGAGAQRAGSSAPDGWGAISLSPKASASRDAEQDFQTF